MSPEVKEGRIAAAWREFEKRVVPIAAGEEQRRAMKMAFYGGGFATLTAIMAMLDPGADPTDADLAKITEVHGEFAAFNREIVQRAARMGTN